MLIVCCAYGLILIGYGLKILAILNVKRLAPSPTLFVAVVGGAIELVLAWLAKRYATPTMISQCILALSLGVFFFRRYIVTLGQYVLDARMSYGSGFGDPPAMSESYGLSLFISILGGATCILSLVAASYLQPHMPTARTLPKPAGIAGIALLAVAALAFHNLTVKAAVSGMWMMNWSHQSNRQVVVPAAIFATCCAVAISLLVLMFFIPI